MTNDISIEGNYATVKSVSAKQSSLSARLKAVAKSSLPPAALKEIQRYRVLNGSERLTFAKFPRYHELKFLVSLRYCNFSVFLVYLGSNAFNLRVGISLAFVSQHIFIF